MLFAYNAKGSDRQLDLRQLYVAIVFIILTDLSHKFMQPFPYPNSATYKFDRYRTTDLGDKRVLK